MRAIDQIEKEIRDCDSLINAAQGRYDAAIARAAAADSAGDGDAAAGAWYDASCVRRDIETWLKFRHEGLMKELARAKLPRVRYTPTATLIEAIRTASLLLDDSDFPEDGKYGPGTFDPQAGEWLPEPTDAYIEWRQEREALADAIARWQEVYDAQ